MSYELVPTPMYFMKPKNKIKKSGIGRQIFYGTPTKRQVSKRQVSKRLASKRPVSKRKVYITLVLQNVRFQNVWFQNVQFLNLIYLLNKKYRNCQVSIPI